MYVKQKSVRAHKRPPLFACVCLWKIELIEPAKSIHPQSKMPSLLGRLDNDINGKKISKEKREKKQQEEEAARKALQEQRRIWAEQDRLQRLKEQKEREDKWNAMTPEQQAAVRKKAAEEAALRRKNAILDAEYDRWIYEKEREENQEYWRIRTSQYRMSRW